MIAWIKQSWFRHILTLRLYLEAAYNDKGVTLFPYLIVRSIWDEDWHANAPVAIQVGFLKWTVWFGIEDTN